MKHGLKDPNNFELWLKSTKAVLAPLNLDRLINLSLLRPKKEDPNAMK